MNNVPSRIPSIANHLLEQIDNRLIAIENKQRQFFGYTYTDFNFI